MLDKKKIEERILRIVSEQYFNSFGRDNGSIEITINTNIRKDLGFDSIMLVILQIVIEDAFGIRFDPMEDDLNNVFTTIQEISRYVYGIMRNEYEQE